MKRFFRLTTSEYQKGDILEGRTLVDNWVITHKVNNQLQGLTGLFCCKEVKDTYDWITVLRKPFFCVIEFPDNAVVHNIDVCTTGLHQCFVESNAVVVTSVDLNEWTDAQLLDLADWDLDD